MIQADDSLVAEKKAKPSSSVKKKKLVKNIVKPAQLHRSEWKGHPTEASLLNLKKGSITVLLVKPDNWLRPSHNLPVSQYVLTPDKPLLEVPGGYVASLKAIEEGSAVEVAYEELEENARKEFSFDKDRWYFDSFF